VSVYGQYVDIESLVISIAWHPQPTWAVGLYPGVCSSAAQDALVDERRQSPFDALPSTRMMMPKASSLADDLWPYILPKVKRAVGNRNGNGNGSSSGGGSGGSTVSSTLAGLDDVLFTSLVDGQTIAWQASASHWTNVTPSGGGGGSYAAGLGIDITGTTISTKRQSAGGIGADTNGLYIAKPLDSGLNLSTSGLAVGAGEGLVLHGGTVAVDSIQIVDTTRGLGVSSNDIYVRLGANSGLHFNADGSVRLGTPADLVHAQPMPSKMGMHNI
jgi:hypothetical protein